MCTKFFYLFLLPVISIAQPAKNNNVKYQLNHVDICVDSITFQSLLNYPFISDRFSSTKIFHDSTGTEYLVRGQEHWLHFLPDKGFYRNRLGATVLQHNSFIWKPIDTIIN